MNSTEVHIGPALGEIITACNAGQAKLGHGACMKSCQGLILCRVSYYREMHFNCRLGINFDKVNGA